MVTITALDKDFYLRYPELINCSIIVRSGHSLFDNVRITGPPKMPGFSRPTVVPVRTMTFENTARKNERRHKKAVAARKAAKDLKLDILSIQKSVTQSIFKRNRYELLGEELDDVLIDLLPPTKKCKTFKKVRICKIPRICISKVPEDITPIYESDIYIQNLTPGPLSIRACAPPKVDKSKLFVKNLKNLFSSRQYKDQALSDIGQLFSLDCILTSMLSNISMEEFLKNLEQLKPINLCNLIGMALAAQDFKTVLGIITAAFELYDFFWTVPAASTHIFCLFLAYAVWWLVKIVKSIINKEEGDLPNLFFDQASFIPSEDENQIRSWLKDHLKIDLTTIPDFIMPLVAGIIGIIALITGGTFSSWADLKFSKVLSRLQKFTKSLKTIDSAMEIVPKVFTTLISTVAGLFGYDYVSSEDKCVIEFKNEILEFKKEVTILADLMAVEPVALLQNTEKLQRMAKIMDALDLQYEKLVRQKFNTAQVKPLLDDIKVCVKKIHNWARIRNQETSTKIEPVFCQLSGPPGVGKSQIIDYLSVKLAQRCGRTTRFTTYTRNPQEKFWANYAGQDLVILDEFNQAKTDDDHNDIMAVKNPNKCSVNMAIAEEKGQQFVSQFIIACSNGLDILSSATVKWRDALNRRRDVLVLMGDQHLEEFKNKHGCFPGAFVDPVTHIVGNPIVDREITTEVEGAPRKILVKVPYFDSEFRHLDFWLVPSLPDCRTDADYKVTNPKEIVELMYAHNQKFWLSYKASLANSNIMLNEIPPPELDSPLDIQSEDGSLVSSIGSDEYYDIVRQKADPRKVLAAMKADVPVATPPNTKNEVNKIKNLAKKREYVEHFQHVSYEDYDDLYGAGPSYYNDAPPEYHNQDAKTTSKSFVNAFGKKGTVFALVGPPGTGKSRLFDLVEQKWGSDIERVHATDLHNFIPSKRILIVDDISINKTTSTITKALVNAVYDGTHMVKLLYISYNKKQMDTMYDSEDERKFFIRRLTPITIDFQIKEKKLLTKDIYYSFEDTENADALTFPHMVTYYDVKNKKVLDRGGAVHLLSNIDVDLQEIVTSLCVAVPEIDPQTLKPDFVVDLKMPMNQACKTLYENPATMLLWLANSEVSIKGNIKDAISIARQFTTPVNGAKPAYPEDLDRFICMVNNAQFMSEKPFITRLNAPDCQLIIMPKKDNPKLIRIFKINPELQIFRNECFEKASPEEKHAMNEATQQEYGDYFAFIKEHQTTIQSTLSTVDEQFPVLAGAAAIFEKAPFVKKVFSVCAFYLRFIMAGTAISSLLKHHDSCKLLFEKDFSKFVMQDEKKRKRIQYDAAIYDDFRSDIDEFGSKSAKKLKVQQVLAKAYDYYGTNNYSKGQFREFVSLYEEAAPFKKKVQLESREVQIPTALQAFQPVAQIFDPVLVPNLVIESLQNKEPPTDMVNEQFIDPASESILELCSNNSVSIVQRHGARYDHIVHGLMIKGTIGCSVAHFVESGVDYYAQFWQNNELQQYPIKILRKSIEFDTLIFKIDDKRCQMFKNLTHFLPSVKSNIAQIAGQQNAILQTTHIDPKKEKINALIRNVIVEEVQRITSDSSSKIALTYTGCITALRTQGQILTRNGDCGSPVILCNPKTNVKIIAVHNAADYQYGAGTLIFKEYFMEFKNESFATPIKNMTHSAVEMIEQQTDFVCNMPVVATGLINTSMPTKTKLWSSPLQLAPTNSYQPAILSQFDKRNVEKIHPYYKAVSKWAHEQPEINMRLLDQAVDEIAEFYANTCYINKENCSVLTTTDAINAGGNSGICQLNRATSPGYPWIQYYPKKQEFLKMNGKNADVYWSIDYDKVHPQLKCKPGQILSDALNQLVEICKSDKDVKPLIVFAGHIKDEPVKLKKVYDVNSRSFAGAPFEYVIAVRKYFGGAVSAIHNVRHLVPSKIGINPTSMEWHNMFAKMLEVSDLGFDADYQHFDSTIPAIVLKKTVKIYNKIYQKCDKNWKPEHDNIRNNLNNALIEPLLSIPHEGKTKIVQAPGGHVSGQPLTADTNCLVNLIYLYMCWLDTFKDDPPMCNFNTFLSYVEIAIYGDDVCVAVHPDVIHQYNCKTLYYFLQIIGITITDAAKTVGEPKPFIKCVNFEFLKRNFVQKGAYYFGPLKEASFEKMLGYTIGRPHYWDLCQNEFSFDFRTMISTMESALQEAVFHGCEYYEYIKNHCLKFCRIYNVQFIPLEYNQMVDFKQVPLPKI
nr:MAG: RNA-dependent RNA polymerase [Spider picorna-like virus 7]